MKKTVLITGSNGFIGKAIVQEMSDEYSVIGIGTADKSSTTTDEYIQWDIGREDIPERLAKKKIDIIVHSASCIDFNDYNENLVYTNCVGTYRIYNLCRMTGVKTIVLLSSIPIVGSPKERKVLENAMPDPDSIYYSTKAAQELLLHPLNYHGVRVVNVRVPSPIGPGQKENKIVPILLRRAYENKTISLLGKGTRHQNYIDVRDIGKIVKYIVLSESVHGTVNIGSKDPISNTEVARECIRVTNSKSCICYEGDDPCDDLFWDIECEQINENKLQFEYYSFEQSLRDMLKVIEDI